ncbi:MAG: hypothetical protein CVU35_02350 [Betaproteobacteria bacterium HGW-Betaproteobacteria-8]|nr:MAG: hypothetical protein CVU35_02350 [Betaproteobacteria bacterium HGW-Betaproteobacteria-8]
MQRHHYVPQFYLREWYVSGKSAFWLYCRDDDGRLIFGHKSARSVGYQSGLYSVIPEIFGIQTSVSNEFEEKFFSPLDSAASRVSRKLIKSGLPSLSTEDRLVWSLFVNSLLERSPTRINEVKEDAKIIAEKCVYELKERFGMSETDQRCFWEMLDIPAITNNAVLTGMVKWICDNETIRHFFDMAWVVIRLPEGKNHFLTGDTPVVVNGDNSGTPIHVLSLALSPSALLVMHTRDEEFDEDFIKKMALLHSPLIAKQTKRYLISSRELLDDGNVKYRRILSEIFTGSK